MSQEPKTGFTGRRRVRRTSKMVKYGDMLARTCITVGGVGTILAVGLVCVFLTWKVLPLFHSPKVESAKVVQVEVDHGKIIHLDLDEFRNISMVVYEDGTVVTQDIATGKKLQELTLVPDGKKLTAWSFGIGGKHLMLGYEDGSTRVGDLGFSVRFLEKAEAPVAAQELEIGDVTAVDGVIYSKTPEGQLRSQFAKLTLEDPIAPDKDGNGAAIRLIDHTIFNDSPIYVTLNDKGDLKINRITRKENWMTGKVTFSVSQGDLPYDTQSHADKPVYLKLAGLGDSVLVTWKDGFSQRFDTRNFNKPVLAETLDLTPQSNHTITALQFMNGRNTLIVGDSSGELSAWFRTKPGGVETSDGSVLTKGHNLPSGHAAATAIAVSSRSRMIVVGFADASAAIYQVTVENQLVHAGIKDSKDAVQAVAMAPKDNGMMAVTNKQIGMWEVDPKYPAITAGAIFLPVWYEGYTGPTHVWQSSAGTDDSEPKYGLYPLIFGTLKATFYSMLFGLPIAILAAVYTSEFLHPRVKAWVKPTIELMASLPSVVLGFLAALVFAPFFEKFVPSMLACVATIPLSFLLGAYLWQLLPHELAIRLDNIGDIAPSPTEKVSPLRMILFKVGGVRLVCLFVMFALSLVAALALGTPIEHLLFAGDVKRWLDGQIGNGIGAWMILLLPLSGLGAAFIISRVVNPKVAAYGDTRTRGKVAVLDLAKFLLACVLTCIIAYAVSALLNGIGWDPRGSYVDTYVQRNALIVGFVMGFAIIPIIYTIAEDALSAVPTHLRSASLGAGATPWQTATRIIMPTAMSGLFSAMMIGLGRAVGETMIVLMAAGNTPVMEMNIFNGFRTLAANIAVELPEAPKDGTHFRMLFLAALTLFAMTFVVNTIAEAVRLRFRKKAIQL
ncbi:MAG: ABC transporter permease subunit [Phycisphaeraceae bacterium JB051]